MIIYYTIKSDLNWSSARRLMLPSCGREGELQPTETARLRVCVHVQEPLNNEKTEQPSLLQHHNGSVVLKGLKKKRKRKEKAKKQ